MEEEIKIEAEMPTTEEVKSFVQEEKSETVEKALLLMRELKKKYESTTESKDIINLNLSAFPEMMEVIRAVEAENIVHREKNEPEFHIEETPEYKGMSAYGLTIDHITRQKELAEQYGNTPKE